MPDIKNKYKEKLVILISVTAIIYFTGLISLSFDVYDVFHNIYYIPVLLSCYWFGRLGAAVTTIITSTHFFICMIYDPDPMWNEMVELLLFLVIVTATCKLTENLKKNNLLIHTLIKKQNNDIERFNKAEKLSGLGSYEINLSTGKVIWSDELYRMFGYQPGSFVPTKESRISHAHPGDRDIIRENIERAIRERSSFSVESRILRADGNVRWVSSMGYVEQDDSGEIEKFIGAILDITERKQLEKNLKEEKEKLNITITSIGDGVIATDNEGNVTLLNKVAEEMTGWTQAEAAGKSIEEIFDIVNEYTRVKCENPVYKVIESGLILGLANHTILISRNGDEKPIADSAAPIVDIDGSVQGVILVFRDVSEEKQRINEIHYMSYYDPLTGLYNRRFFDEEIKKLDKESHLPISIIMGDVNGLKLINDAFGHSQGDLLIKNAAKAIKSACRAGDIAIRLGGDEFVILLPKTGRKEAEAIVERIKNCCCNKKIGQLSVSIAFGLDTKIQKVEDLSKILKNAEDQMYKHKVVESSSMRGNIINTIFSTLKEKNPKVSSHSIRVSQLCYRTGILLNLTETELHELKVSGLLHDIGKIAIDDVILNKSEVLTEFEMELIRSHSDIGYRIINSSAEMTKIAQFIQSHHERFDGSGYPKGIKQEEIPLVSRIISVVDAYDAMVNERSYKKVLSKSEAIDELNRYKGIQFDPRIVDIFVGKVLNSYNTCNTC